MIHILRSRLRWRFKVKLSLIAACSRNRVIGVANRLPWNLPDDLKYFKEKTSGHPVIMGRKTFESIGRPLPKRLNLVITRQRDYVREGVTVVASLESAIQAARLSGAEEAFVIGGAEIYAQALARADRLYLTLVNAETQGDAYFPEWKSEPLKEIARTHHACDEKHEFDFDFVVLEKS